MGLVWYCKTFFILAVILLLTMVIKRSEGYPSGAGLSACQKLSPNHEQAPLSQESTSPYSLEIVREEATYTYGRPLIVKVTTASLPWKGIFLQARALDGEGTVGSWEEPEEISDTKLMQCDSPADTITHQNDREKSTVYLKWLPPKRSAGNIIFTGAIAANYHTWWDDQTSYILEPYYDNVVIETTAITTQQADTTNATMIEENMVTLPTNITETPKRKGKKSKTLNDLERSENGIGGLNMENGGSSISVSGYISVFFNLLVSMCLYMTLPVM